MTSIDRDQALAAIKAEFEKNEPVIAFEFIADAIAALPAIPLDREDILYQGIEAMRLTREYVHAATLPAVEGWSWFDFVVKAQAALGLTNEWWNDPAHTGDSQHVSDELPTAPRERDWIDELPEPRALPVLETKKEES